jgi:hypothetical protein
MQNEACDDANGAAPPAGTVPLTFDQNIDTTTDD